MEKILKNDLAPSVNPVIPAIDANGQLQFLKVASDGSMSVATKWIDTLGNVNAFKVVDGLPRVCSQTYLQQIAEGNVSNHTAWSKIGFTPTMNTTESDLWVKAGAYVWPTVAGKWEVVSSDNTQDKATVLATGTATGGTTTTLIDSAEDFTAETAVAVGDCVILDKAGTTPEWGYVTNVTATTLTISGGFSSGGSASGRGYDILDASAYTHAQAVKIDYLDANYLERTEIVILNGTSAVDTVNTDLFRVNSFRVIAAGSAGLAKGNLTLQADGAGATYSYIPALYTRARNSIYTVPAGKNLFITQYAASFATTGNANKEYARIYTRANMEPSTGFHTGNIFYGYTEMAMQNSTAISNFDSPTKLTPKTDIKISGIASATGVACAVLRGWIENA